MHNLDLARRVMMTTWILSSWVFAYIRFWISNTSFLYFHSAYTKTYDICCQFMYANAVKKTFQISYIWILTPYPLKKCVKL